VLSLARVVVQSPLVTLAYMSANAKLLAQRRRASGVPPKKIVPTSRLEHSMLSTGKKR